MTRMMTIGGAIAALAMMPGTALAAGSMNFSIGDVAIKGSIPDGYCVPTGRNKSAADLLAKGDTENATPVTLMRCDQQDKPDGMRYDYYLIKAPRMDYPPMTRADFIKMMAEELALPTYQSGNAGKTSLDDAGSSLTDTFGTKVDLSGEIKPRGTDNVCVYLGGEVKVSSSITSYPIVVGGCGTIVGGKMLFVYSYDDPAKADGVATQLRRARAVVDKMKAADGRPN
jgi:hypothetical protein